jgi:signal peptidase I
MDERDSFPAPRDDDRYKALYGDPMRVQVAESSIPGTVEEMEQPGLGRQILRFIGDLFQTLVVAGLLFLVVNILTARIRVESVSMLPSLQEGEFVVVNRVIYLLDQPERGDIVVFRFPLDENRRYIKRIIGKPGDTVMVLDGIVYINGDQIDEPYISAAPRYSGEWTVEQGELFVLGDNRNNSLDSKNWGTLPAENVIGRAELVYWPLDQMRLIPHLALGG